MAGGAIMVDSGGQDFPANLTAQVIVCTIIAAFGGLMFGYDIGISGTLLSQLKYKLSNIKTTFTKL